MDALAGRLDGAPPRAGAKIGVVAVAAGDGFRALMRSLGAVVVHGGQTMNPSAGEIARAIDATGAARVIVLPGNKNIVLAARQAAEAAQADVSVVPALSVPAGVAALVALNAEEPFDANVRAMEQAVAGIAAAEITHAVRTTTIDGRAIREGQAIGIVDGDLTVAEDSIEAAVHAAIGQMVARREAPLVTLYYGEEIDEAQAEAVANDIRARHACEVEVVRGGQPQYAYLIGVE
jgi:dihydroxyacetone kinase-like predicted kinase